MRIAIIDLGTNTFNLLITENSVKGDSKVLFKRKIAVKLGEGGIDKGIIASDAYERGIQALKEHKASLQEYNVEKYKAFATSAIRSTKNGLNFVNDVDQQLGIKIEVIDGDKEAELIYLGVREVLEMNQSYDLIMDIGGGSTEFIIANNEGVVWAKSYQLGVSRLKEILKPSDPIPISEIKQIENYIEKQLKDFFEAISKTPCLRLIGSSGSFDTIVEMIAKRYNDEIRIQQKCAAIHHHELDWTIKYLLESDLNLRLNTPGLIKMRADMIVISAIFINYILKKTGIKSVKRSKFALKEGALSLF